MAESRLEHKILDFRVYALNPSAFCLLLPYYVIDDVGPKARDTDEQTERPKHGRSSRANTQMWQVRYISFKDHIAGVGGGSHTFLKDTGALQQVCLFMFAFAFLLLDSVLENCLFEIMREKHFTCLIKKLSLSQTN